MGVALTNLDTLLKHTISSLERFSQMKLDKDLTIMRVPSRIKTTLSTKIILLIPSSQI